MKRTLLFLSLLLVVTLACDMTVRVVPTSNPAPQPTDTMIVSTEIFTQVPTTIAPQITDTASPASNGVQVSVDPLTVTLSPAVTTGARGLQVSRAEGDNVSPWDVTPGHVQLTLEGYVLQDRFHEPQIYVYPALEYAQMLPAAFESMHRLNNIFYDPTTISNDQLPLVPFFNASQVFASNVQVISFQNGRGVRFLTEYAQYAASVNNHDLFYHFQGLTQDGEYYVIAILPISMPALAATSDAGAVLPSGGIPYPDISNPNADFPDYYAAVTNLLNTTTPDVFTPNLNQLDQLIQSIQIAK